MDNPVTVQVYPYRSDAEIAVVRLAADGIDAAIRADDEGGLNPGFFSRYGVRVVVRASDLVDAYESLGIERVTLPSQVADAMFKHSGWAYPNEACGLVAFAAGGVPRLAICLSNSVDAGDRFTISPAEMFGAITLAERSDLTIGAVFHSHPRSEAYPSQFDIDGGGDPEWLHFIVGPVAGPKPLLRAYRIQQDEVVEVQVSVGE